MKRLIGIVGKQGAMACGLLLLLILLAAGRSLANRSDDDGGAGIENEARSLSELVGQPVCTWIPALRYPPAVRDRSLSGRVLVSVFLDKDGRIIDTEVLDSDLPELFIVEALKAARLSRFKAKSVGGLSTHSSVVLPFRFDALETPTAIQTAGEEHPATQTRREATLANKESSEASRSPDDTPVVDTAATIAAEQPGETEPASVPETPLRAVPAEPETAPAVSSADDPNEASPDLSVPDDAESDETPSITVLGSDAGDETVEVETSPRPTLDNTAGAEAAEDASLPSTLDDAVSIEMAEDETSPPPTLDNTAGAEVIPAATSSYLTLDDAGFGKAVSNRTLEGRAEIFPEGERVFFWIAVSGGGGRSVIRHVWFRDGREIQSIELTLRGSPWHTWSYKTLFAGMAGDWRVDVLDSEDRLIGSRSFVCAKGESSD